MNKPTTSAVPLPPKDADVLTTACDYCIVACGYKIYRWPVGKEGGPSAEQNALNASFPVGKMSGQWVSPINHSIVMHKNKKHHVVIMADADAKVVNVDGNHSIRGGGIAQKCYNPDTLTKDRLKTPLLRVNGSYVPISWDDATTIFAALTNHVIFEFGPHAWAQKRYSYQYFENTYALSKFAWSGVGSPSTAEHDNPGHFSSTPGFRDVGIDNFSAAYEDYYLADTLFISGCDPYETKSVLFTSWMMKGVKEKKNSLIIVNPRKTPGCAFAEQNGGLHLAINPGTDTLLHLALARIIIENNWQDADWIKTYTNNKWESNEGFGQGTRNTPWQWRTTWGTFQCNGYEDYKKWLFDQKESNLDYAVAQTGLAKADILKAAELMAKPRNGKRTKTTFAIEKGNYWSNNYLNTASIATLALICGSGNRPGQMVSRLGGHQRGGVSGASGLRNLSPQKYAGRRRKGMDLDRWVCSGNVKFAWVVGTTWVNAMAGTNHLTQVLKEKTVQSPFQVKSSEVSHVIDTLKNRINSEGMVVVEQNIYQTEVIGKNIADLILPAATWGEDDFSRANGERRIRLYSKFMDPPGQALPDWKIVSMLAKKLGYEGYDWKTSNDVFEEAARFTRNGILNYHPLVQMAKRNKQKGHELLRSLGTEGIQGPIRNEGGKLVGTKRLHDSTLKLDEHGPEQETVWIKKLTAFNSQTGKANFIKTPWKLFADYYAEIKPRGDEVWILNGRINEIWQSGFDDRLRRPNIIRRWPENFVEVHPQDATKYKISNGDYVELTNSRVSIQTGGFVMRDEDDATFAGLKKAGHIEYTKASIKAVAIVTAVVKPGVTFVNFLDPKSSANALVPRIPDPITNNYRYKLGFGTIKSLGPSPYVKDLSRMSLTTRTLV